MDELSEQKKALRRLYQARGRTLTAEYRQRADRAICALVTGTPQWQGARAVFLYVSMWAEPDTRPLFEAAFRAGKRVYAPLCGADGTMKAVHVRDLNALQPGAWGIPEPPDDGAAAEPGEVGLALVPCVTVTRAGARLGHGAGCYDRFLRLHGCESLCLCYAAMLAESLPTQAHDVRMDYVLTEAGIIRIE